MNISISLNTKSEPEPEEKKETLTESLTSKDNVLSKMLIPIKEYLETNLPKGKEEEMLLDAIRQVLQVNSKD